MADSARLDVVIGMQDKASAKLKKVSNNMGMLSKQGLAAGAMFAVVNHAVTMLSSQLHKAWQFVDEGVQKWRKFEDQMAEINTMLSETEKKHLPEMRDAIEDLSITWGKSAEDMANAMYQTLSASVDASRAIEFLGTASKIATAGLTSVETAVDVLTTILNAYNMTVSEAEHISDVLFQTVKEGKLRFQDLASALGFVVPIAAQMNVTIEELTAALATMTKQGINANMASRGLRVMLNTILRPTEDAKDAAADYGIMLDGLHFSVVGLSGFIDELNEGLGENKLAMADMFQNVRALTGILALTAHDGELYRETFTSVMEDAGGAASKAALEIVESGGFISKVITQITTQMQKDVGEKQTDFWNDASVAVLKFGHGLQGVTRSAAALFSGIPELLGAEGFQADQIAGMKYHTKQIKELNDVEGDVEETKRKLIKEMRAGIEAYDQESTYIENNIGVISEYIKANDILINQAQHSDNVFAAALETIGNFDSVWNKANDIISQGATALAEWEAKGLLVNRELDELADLIPDVTQKIANMREILNIENDMYKASMALKDVSVSFGYTSDALSGMVSTLVDYKNKLDDMRSTQRAFTREQKLLNIEMLELTLGTSKRGKRGRGYKHQVDELKRQQDELRLQTMKGDIKLTDFKENFYDKANESYNKYILEQQVLMRDLAGARDEEIVNLERQLDNMLFYQETYNKDLVIILQKEGEIREKHYANLRAMDDAHNASGIATSSDDYSESSEPLHKIQGVSKLIDGLYYAYSSSGAMKTFADNPPKLNDIVSWQTGTPYVPRTGLALLHQGEAVIPADKNRTGATSVRVAPITINVNNNMTTMQLVQSIQNGISGGLVSGLTTVFG